VGDGLKHRPMTVLSYKEAHFLRLALVEFEDDGEREENTGLDDGKGAVCPAPGRVPQERLGGQWSRERGADKRRARKAKSKGSIPQP